MDGPLVALRPRAAFALLAVALFVASCTSVPDRTGGDPKRGEAVATQWCGVCHSVRGVEADKTRAPTFEQVAQRPGRGVSYLSRFLEEDHFPMTTYRLLDAEKADVIALIVSLKK